MDIFKKSEFDKLKSIHSSNCLSIYIPTHVANEEGEGIKKDQTRLKNELKEAEKQLNILEYKQPQIDSFLKPVGALIDDIDFWRHQSNGLAIFYDNDELRTYSIPRSFNPITYVGTQFYLKPMTDLLHRSGRHFILQLSLGEVKLYQATENTISEVKIDDLVPNKLTEAVGSDLEDSHLERRSGQGEKGGSEGIYHGQGAGSDTEKKKEALKYFREVDEGLMKLLHDESSPLIVACVDYLYPIYQEANSYKDLADSHISGNFEDREITVLKEKAWEIVSEKSKDRVKEDKKKVSASLNENKASDKIDEIVHASISGRTEILFLKEDEEVWGTYDREDGSVKISEVRKVGDTGLFNLAAIKTIENGGEVYLLPHEEMPIEESSANALFRYAM